MAAEEEENSNGKRASLPGKALNRDLDGKIFESRFDKNYFSRFNLQPMLFCEREFEKLSECHMMYLKKCDPKF